VAHNIEPQVLKGPVKNPNTRSPLPVYI
jgi:hypothetical protein